MDHLTVSGNSHLLAIEIHFVCTEEPTCKASDFLHWPSQLSWARVDSQRALAARAQSWLYFGLLSAFLGEDFEREELSQVRPSGQRVIDSSSLERRILKWKENLHAQSSSSVPDGSTEDAIDSDLLTAERFRVERIVKCAILAMNHEIIPALNRLESSSDINVWDSMPHAVILSVDILLDLLIGAINYLSNSEVGLFTGRAGPGGLPRRALTAENQVLARSLLRAGRCPSLCWRLRPSSSSFYALLLLPQVVEVLDHSKCPSIKCTAHNIDRDTYETVHTSSCRGCKHVPVNVEDVLKCIKKGGIPLVALVEDSKGHLEAKIIERNARHQYVAISHVWSGGLGNFRSNSLPDCQLRRLRALLSSLPYQPPELFESLVPFPIRSRSVLKALRFPSNVQYGAQSHLFWMDSLCIPVDKELEVYRNDAIKSMAEIYAAATSILVIDPELQQISLKSADLDLNSLTRYIQCSPWMARSWTLQEGALAMEVFMVFRDGIESARNLLALARRQFPHTPILSRQGLDVPWQRVLDFESAGYRSYSVSEYKLNRFISAWNGLCTRSTTEQADVPGIFAVLVGLSPKEILSFSKGDAMKAAIKAQELIPLSVLYQSLTPSRSRHGGRWNPPFPGVDDMTNTTSPLDVSCGLLQVTNDGFIVKDSGYGLVGFMVRGEPPTSKILHLTDQQTKGEVWIHMDTSDKSCKDTATRKSFFMFTPVPALGRDGMPGAVFTVQSYDSENITLSYVSSITVFFSPRISYMYEFVDAEHWVQPGTFTKKILIEADIGSWPVLQWTRQNTFPFGEIYNDYLMVWFISGMLSWILTWLGGAGSIVGDRLWPSISKIPFIVCGILRFAFTITDLSIWFLDLRDFVHKKWAASFSEWDKLDRRDLVSHSPFSWTMGTNVLSFVAAFILLVGWAFFSQLWMMLCATCLLCEIILRSALAPIVRVLYITPFFARPVEWDRASDNVGKRLVSLTRDL